MAKKKKIARKKTVSRKRTVKRLRKIPLPRAFEPQADFSPESFFKAKIKVIGIGGGGASILSEIGRVLEKATFVIADTDTRVAKNSSGIKYLLFGSKLTHGLGTGMNPQLARTAAEPEKEKIQALAKDQNILILIACLGGGVGSEATQVFAEALANFDGITFGIFTLPFKFEGKAKYQIALRSLAKLRKLLNVSITIPNENIFRIISEDTPITEAFSMVNKQLIESLESLIDLIYNPGVINIDFADLKAVLQGKGNLAFLNTAQASGKDRLKVIVDKALHNPLYRAGNFSVQRIMFNIQGGGNLSMFEVDKISRAIAEHHKEAKIIFGISKNSKYKNTIKATILMVGPANNIASEPNEPSVRPKPKNNVKKRRGKAVRGEPVSPSLGSIPVLRAIPIGLGGSEVQNADSKTKKAIQRRTALEARKKREIEEQKRAKQEEEWEIPAFLRLKK